MRQGVLKPEDVSYSSLYRFLKTLGLAGSKQKKEPERKRFAYEKVKAMWYADISSGPYIKMGKRKVPTFLFAFLDDASRLVPYALYTLDQGFDSLKTVFKEALSRRGIPQMIYTDNGKIYTSQQFQWVCASLGIALVHTRPYDPSAKGKIERFFLSVRQRFLSTLDCEGLTLDSLNQSFLTWLERDYNSRPHSTIGMSPTDMYMSQSSSLKMLDDPSILEPLFLLREIRKVRHDSTISVQNHLFEVPPALIGKRVEVRFDPDDLSEVLMILGEPGCGKTYALRSVAESLNSSLYRTIFLPLSTGTAIDMYRAIAADLGEEPRFRKVDLFGQMQKAVGHLYDDKKITPVFITNKMHLAGLEFFLDLAMIFNFSMDSKNPFVLVMSGLPFFQSHLRLNQAQCLAQRIIVQYKFEPLDKDEVKGYLDHRLRLAGAVTPIFTDQAIEATASHTGGWPRLIKNLASTALLYGAKLKRNRIDEDVIRMAAEETSL